MDIEAIAFLTDREKKIAGHLLANRIISETQFREFLDKRKKIDTGGKAFLGGMLVGKGLLEAGALEEFFQTNNRIYLDLLGQMKDGGYLSEAQYAAVMRADESKTNVVAALERLNIMTRESFIRICSNRVNLLKLGEWLVMNGKLKREVLEEALEEQHVNNLEDYLIHRKLVGRDLLAGLVDIMGLH